MNLFTEHPASVGESYGEHMRSALSFSGAMFVGAAACAVHAFLPFLCLKTGSRTITRLHERMVTHRHKHAQPASAQPGAAVQPAE